MGQIMTKAKACTILLGLFLSANVFALDLRCQVNPDSTAEIRDGKKTLVGFSSEQQCQQQVGYLRRMGEGTVLCGCRSSKPLYNIIGVLVGVTETDMSIECFQVIGEELKPLKDYTYNYGIAIMKGGKVERDESKISDCNFREKQLWSELNGTAQTAQAR
jgi:hypothetical protein